MWSDKKIKIVFLLLKKSRRRWPEDWPRHVGDDNTGKVHQ
jgi:hypothetical protein